MAPLSPANIIQGLSANNKQEVTGKSILFERSKIFIYLPHSNETSWARQYFSFSSCAFKFLKYFCIRISVLAELGMLFVFSVQGFLHLENTTDISVILWIIMEAPFISQSSIIKWNLHT